MCIPVGVGGWGGWEGDNEEVPLIFAQRQLCDTLPFFLFKVCVSWVIASLAWDHSFCWEVWMEVGLVALVMFAFMLSFFMV